MLRKQAICFWVIPVALSVAASQPWKDKAIPSWTDDDAHAILDDSPWAKSVQPTTDASTDSGQGRSRGTGRGGGINLGGIGLPGTGGMGRHGGGYPGGGYPRRQSGGTGRAPSENSQPPTLRLRWESALPVRAAELKGHDVDAPTLDEDHYAIAVYGVPSRLAASDSQGLDNQLKKAATIKRDGKKDLKPSGAEVLQRSDGRVVVYLFSRSNEITLKDGRVEFDATIGKLHLSQFFFVSDMVFQGKLEL